MRDFMGFLTKKQKAAWDLVEGQGKSHKQAAKKLKISERAVTSRMSRARKPYSQEYGRGLKGPFSFLD